jgi:hypothetical protein
MTFLKSIGAILVGFIVGAALSVGTDTALQALNIFPPLSQGFFVPWMIVLAIIYRSTYNVAGCYITAALAPGKPMVHVMVIGVLGFVLTIVGTVMHSDKGPLWYGITLAALTIPCAWLGATLRIRARKVQPAS